MMPKPNSNAVGRFQRWLLLLSLVQSYGCQEDPSNGPLTSPVVHRLGDTTFVNNDFLRHTDTAEMVEIARIIHTDGPEDLQLFSWTQLTVGPRGEVYVSDPSGVREISPDGSEVRWIARRGEGPGEVRNVLGMNVDALGRLLVVDFENRRINTFDSLGTLIREWRLPAGMPGTGMSAITPLNDGDLLLPIAPPLGPGAEKRSFPRPIFVRLDQGGEVLDTVYVPLRLHEKCPFEEDARWTRGNMGDTREEVLPKVQWAATREGAIVYGCPTNFELEQVSPSGEVLKIRLNKPPILASQEERDWWVSGLEENVNIRNPGWRWTGPSLPAERPFFRRILVGRYGRIWTWPGLPGDKEIREGKEVWISRKTGAFDVFEPDGTFLGSVRLPEGARFRPSPGLYDPFIAGDTIWIFRRDSLDVKYLSKMLIRW